MFDLGKRGEEEEEEEEEDCVGEDALNFLSRERRQLVILSPARARNVIARC